MKVEWKPAHPSNFRRGRLSPVRLIVVHVMDGSLFGSTTEVMMQLPQGKAKSWHYGIGWDWPNRAKVGLIPPVVFQHVADGDTAFHSGTIGKRPASFMVRSMGAMNPNEYSIGIECHGTGSVWHKIINPVLSRLIADLCKRHGLKANRETVVGHNEVDEIRRANCPGRNCNLDKIVADAAEMIEDDVKLMNEAMTKGKV